MAIKLTGTIHKVLPLATGESRNGVWKKQEFILQTDDQYPKQICCTVWGEKIDEKIIKPGTPVTISADIESREYNGRWYTEVKVWRFENAASSAPAASAKSAPGSSADIHPLENNSGEPDLPF
jgi:single-stranded DNA-binding protein